MTVRACPHLCKCLYRCGLLLPLLPACLPSNFLEPTPTLSHSLSLALFISKEKRKRQTEIEGKRQELDEQILLLQHCKVSGRSPASPTVRHAARPAEGWAEPAGHEGAAARGQRNWLFSIQPGHHRGAFLGNFPNPGHCYGIPTSASMMR